MSSMYLVLPVPFRLVDGRLHVEAQAANGLDRWADHFDSVTVAAPLVPESHVPALAGFVWRDLASLEHAARIHAQPLPWAYAPLSFVKNLRPVQASMAENIAAADHLQFAIGGLVGDWASVAARVAHRQDRRYAIHTDRVEHEVMRKTASAASGLRRLKIAVETPLMERYHRHIIGHAALGLWHGDDCFRAYAPWCRENHLVHDVHTSASDLISAEELARKLEDVLKTPALRLCYTGRLDPMKAPLEWLHALKAARNAGASFHATWYGEGGLRTEAEAECTRLGLGDLVTFAGFVSDRATLLAHVRAAHALIFTHITPESPRNLLEALVSGTAVFGYDNAYAADLLAGRGGGALVPLHATEALGAKIAELAQDRTILAAHIAAAAQNGRRFTDAAVFGERSDLVKLFA